MMAAPRVLTFNFHEPYLCLMAAAGIQMDVGEYEHGHLARSWHTSYRPVPENVRIIGEQTWREALRAGAYDVLIAHNEMNAMDVVESPAAKILVCHNRRTFLQSVATVKGGNPQELFAQLLERLSQLYRMVFISESKKRDYGLEGRVILPGIDVDQYGGYSGEVERVLRVGNLMRERNLMFDVDLQEAACAGLENRLVGVNPGIPASIPSNSFGDLLNLFRTYRSYLHVTREAYEDGYNLAMLEAMACGMPVVSLANATSPLTHNADGLVGTNAEELNAHLRALLGDPDQARTLGARGRDTVAEKFSLAAFGEKWRAEIGEAADSNARYSTGQHQTAKLNILMHYVRQPITTGQYLEQALRKHCEVLTAGFRLPEPVLEMWGFTDPPPYPAQDVDLPHPCLYRQMLGALPSDFHTDVYFYVDSGLKELQPDIGLLTLPKVAYLIDTHVSPELRLAMARHFDSVFMAQKGQIDDYAAAGIEKLHWLPLACSPELHDVPETPRTLDLAYVGSLNSEEMPRRQALLHRLAALYPDHFIGRAWPHEMAAIYARAKIIVNVSHNRDVNMRVFEALASGALLITDESDGLEDLFEDGKHLIVYRKDEDLFDVVAFYLENDEARENIAAAGRAEVYARHTYDHRIAELLRIMAVDFGGHAKPTIHAKTKQDTYYSHPRRELIPYLPLKAKRVLDIGCGGGGLGHILKTECGAQQVVGVEIVREAAEAARDYLDAVHLGSIEDLKLPYDAGHFDCIICADVLEHLVEPEQAIRKLGRLLNPEGALLISIPNVQYHDVLSMLSTGGWHYIPEGILDSTHLRWFTRESLDALVRGGGLEIGRVAPLNAMAVDRLPGKNGDDYTFGKITYHHPDETTLERLCTYQHIVVACHPGVDRLAGARAALEARDYEQAYLQALDAVGVDERARQILLARAHARLGRLQDAADIYKHLLDDTYEAEAAGEYGIVLVTLGHNAEALPLLKGAVIAYPENQRLHGALGLVLWNNGALEEAHDHLATALQDTFDHPELIVPLVHVSDGLGKREEALSIVQRYAEFYPGNTEIGYSHAAILAALDRNVEARDRLDLVLMADPAHVQAQALLQKLNEGQS